MDGIVIELVNLTKQYGSFKAVDQLNLSIRKGEVFGLLGPNGAGKSTTILMMLGLTEPTSGKVSICGFDSSKNPIDVKKRIGYLPEDVGFYEDLTGLENLVYTARINGISYSGARDKALKLLARIGLSDAVHKKAGKYSRGMRQRLGLADVLIKSPEIIILDEPTLGIDPKGVREFLDLIVELSKEEGITVLFSSHHLHQVQKVCDRVGLFVNGKLLAVGDVPSLSDQLFSNNRVIIETAIEPREGVPNSSITIDWLKNTLRDNKDVRSISFTDGIFRLECTGDITADIARSVVQSGAGLKYLNKKEYGLDDIYYRYFEGGQNHG